MENCYKTGHSNYNARQRIVPVLNTGYMFNLMKFFVFSAFTHFYLFTFYLFTSIVKVIFLLRCHEVPNVELPQNWAAREVAPLLHAVDMTMEGLKVPANDPFEMFNTARTLGDEAHRRFPHYASIRSATLNSMPILYKR